MANETEKERETRERTEREQHRAAEHQKDLQKDKAEANEALRTHPRDKDAQRRAARAAARDPFSNAPEIRFVTPYDDPEGLITAPLADPIANSTALVIPPAVLDESLLPEDEQTLPTGEPMPDLRTLSGVQQERVEVLTGKRLQRDDAHVTPSPEESRQHRLAEREARERPGRPIINPRPPQPGQLPATS